MFHLFLIEGKQRLIEGESFKNGLLALLAKRSVLACVKVAPATPSVQIIRG
jgi:hypothetical protein